MDTILNLLKENVFLDNSDPNLPVKIGWLEYWVEGFGCGWYNRFIMLSDKKFMWAETSEHNHVLKPDGIVNMDIVKVNPLGYNEDERRFFLKFEGSEERHEFRTKSAEETQEWLVAI